MIKCFKDKFFHTFSIFDFHTSQTQTPVSYTYSLAGFLYNQLLCRSGGVEWVLLVQLNQLTDNRSEATEQNNHGFRNKIASQRDGKFSVNSYISEVSKGRQQILKFDLHLGDEQSVKIAFSRRVKEKQLLPQLCLLDQFANNRSTINFE